MTNFIDETGLASYPGVNVSASSAETLALVLTLTNGLITDIVGSPDPVPTRVTAIAYEVAARALRNPEGYESVTRGVDDWKKTVRYANAASLLAGVYLTADEVKDLRGKKGVKRVKSVGLKVPSNGLGC